VKTLGQFIGIVVCIAFLVVIPVWLPLIPGIPTAAQMALPAPNSERVTDGNAAIHQHGLAAVDPAQPIPSLVLELQPDAMDGYNLHLAARHYRFTPDQTNQKNVNGQGHAHLYINGQKIKRLYGPWEHLSSKLFQPGESQLAVTLNANDHAVWLVNRSEVMAQMLVDTQTPMTGAIASNNLFYTLDWDWGKAIPNKTGQGWVVTTDLDYRVMLERGYLTTNSVELIPCDDTSAAKLSEAEYQGESRVPDNTKIQDALFQRFNTRILNPFKLQPAYAGHGNPVYNPSRLTRPYVETLTRPAAVQIETHSVPRAAYCQAHYLVARAAGAVQNQPADPTLGGVSLWLEGKYKAPRSAIAKPFTIKTRLAWGTITRLTTLPPPLSLKGLQNNHRLELATRASPVRITLRRNLGAMFDGVDFESMSERDRAKAVLRTLTRSVETIVTRT